VKSNDFVTVWWLHRSGAEAQRTPRVNVFLFAVERPANKKTQALRAKANEKKTFLCDPCAFAVKKYINDDTPARLRTRTLLQ
jgi:hypothetical protein